VPFNATRSFESIDPQAGERQANEAAMAARDAQELVHVVMRHVVSRLANGTRDRAALARSAGIANNAYTEAAEALAASRDAADASLLGDTPGLERAAREAQAHAAQARLHADNAMYLLPASF
jgi:hypothetical protein